MCGLVVCKLFVMVSYIFDDIEYFVTVYIDLLM